MKEEVLPPSPNWFLSNILAHLGDNTIAYGARNWIIIAKFLSENQTPEISTIVNAHKEKVSILAASPTTDVGSAFWQGLASAGDDSLVKVWNWETLAPIVAHNAHTAGAKVTALDWSKLDSNLVVSADEQGTVVSWDLLSNTTQKYNFLKLVPTCLSCCPHRRDLVAVGTRTGLVCTISLKGWKMLHRLGGHDSEVVSLAWCPVAYNVLQSKNTQEDALLASGAKEKTIYIWKAGGDGRYETVLHLPTSPLVHDAPGSYKHRSRLGPSTGGVAGGGWTCVSWPEPNTLLSSSLFGELISFDLGQTLAVKSSKPAVAARQWKLLHACHGRGLFSIALGGPWKLADGGNDGHDIGGDSGQRIWTTAQDRQIVVFDWKTERVVASVPTLGGFVYCLAPSPLDSNRIAFGAGDGVVRVWNVSNTSSIEITAFWQKIKGKVMALAWHPSKEGWLAYGTSEGRVGMFDVSCGKLPILFRPYHRRNVYSLCWGPSFQSPGGEGSASKVWLYSCGDGDVIAYDPGAPNEEPFSLREVAPPQKNVSRTDIAWKPDYSLLAVGNEDGTINLLAAPHLQQVQTLFAHKKLIQCMAWHPESTATDTEYSPYQHWLATTSNEAHIKVFDLSPLMQDPEVQKAEALDGCITLNGHTSRVVSIAWSSHIGGQLVSVSYDFTAQIWNVPAEQPVANFSAHWNHVYCCAWSPLDPDVVLTGSADYTLRVWRVSKQTSVVPEEKKKYKKTGSYGHSLKMAEDAASREGKETVDEVSKLMEFARNEKEATKKKRSARKSFFPISSSLHSQGRAQHLENCYHLLAATDGRGEEMPSYLGFFCGREATLGLLETEVQQHVSDGNLEMAQHMELWRGNVSEMLREAARQKKLSDWLVSLAPMASQRLWMEMCKAYADQLKACGQYQKAASYLLVCHKVSEAIDLLVEHRLFREALAIARCRLGPDDPTPKKVIAAWAKHVTSEGHYELAVECLLSIGELMEAAMLIRKRNDEGSLKLAAFIASKAGSQELAAMLAGQSLKQSLIMGNCGTAREVALQHPELKHLKLMVTVQDILQDRTAATNPMPLISSWLQPCEKSTEKALLEEISSRFGCEEERETIYEMTKKDFGKYESPDTIDKVWFVVTAELAMASTSSSEEEKLRHLVLALNTCYQFMQLLPSSPQNLVLQLCMWLTPQGPFCSTSVISSEAVITRSMKAYLCIGVVDWLSTAKCSLSEPFVDLLKTCMNDVLTKESLQYFQDCVKIKKWEHEAAGTAAKLRKGEIDGDVDGILLKLERLKQDKKEFEEKFCSTPNPFVAYCKMKDLFTESETLSAMLERLWKEVSLCQGT